MSDVMVFHEAICRCDRCKGTTDKEKLCPACKRLDDEIDKIKAEQRASAKEDSHD